MFNEKELKVRYNRRLKEVQRIAFESGKPDYSFGWDVTAFVNGPQAELLARLNALVRWIDPGEPVNWRGL